MRQEFNQPVAQVGAGDIVNRGPQLNSSTVVNVHLVGPVTEPKPPVELLTIGQRAILHDLVERYSALIGQDKMRVWGQVLARVGKRKLKEVPVDRFTEMEKYLADLLRDAEASKPDQVANRVQQDASLQGQASTNPQLGQPCRMCEKLRADRNSAREELASLKPIAERRGKRLGTVFAFAALSTGCALVLGYLSLTEVEADQCLLNGIPVPLGGIVDLEDSVLSCEIRGGETPSLYMSKKPSPTKKRRSPSVK